LACFAAVRAGVVLAVLLLAAAPSTSRAAVPYWSVDKVLRMIDGKTLQIGSRKVRLRAETTLCAGQGASIRPGRRRMWRRFVCTYTTFTKSGVDRDLDFELRVRGATRYSIAGAHWVAAAR
jgi:hypothetical protein